jgi:hypothetical protein
VRGWLEGVLTGRSAGLGTLLWGLYVRRDKLRNPDFATPFQPINVQSLLAGARAIDVVPMRKGSSTGSTPPISRRSNAMAWT